MSSGNCQNHKQFYMAEWSIIS